MAERRPVAIHKRRFAQRRLDRTSTLYRAGIIDDCETLKAMAVSLAPVARLLRGLCAEPMAAKAFAAHLIEWLPDYALAEDELRTAMPT